ncbi:MAG: PLP-dependent aminotransferase family protein [Campylobacterales bacterium]
MKRSFVRQILEVIGSDTISFAGGLPDESLLPATELSQLAGEVLNDPKSLQYGPTSGLDTLREKIAWRYTRAGFPTCADEILITTGAQQGLDLIARAHTQKTLQVFPPVYLGALGVFGLSKITLTCEHGADLAYVMSDFSNPSGTRLSLKERQCLAESLQKTRTLLVEDGAYGELWFDHPSPSIAAMMPKDSYHLGSFSKVLSPGLRVGWVRASIERLSTLVVIKERADLHTATLNQRLIDRFWQTHDFEGRLQTIRSHYAQKCDALTGALKQQLPELAFQKPDGGMFIYGTFPAGINARRMAFASLENGAVFVPGDEFYFKGGGENEARLNFTHPSLEEIDKGVKILAETFRRQSC